MPLQLSNTKLIRPQTLTPYSPVAHNGPCNAMKSLSLPSRSPYVSGLMAWGLHRIAWCNGFCGSLCLCANETLAFKGTKESKPLVKSYTWPRLSAKFLVHLLPIPWDEMSLWDKNKTHFQIHSTSCHACWPSYGWIPSSMVSFFYISNQSETTTKIWKQARKQE